MRWACVMLCACNQVYGLEPTATRDAAYFDAPIDAPFSCPPLGAPLAFSPKLSQLALDCAFYTASTTKNVALASCRDAADVLHVSIGPVDGPFTPLAAVGTPTPSLELSQPQLAFDGDLFLLHGYDISSNVSEVRVYRDAGGTWVRGGDFPAPLAVTTNPSRAPGRRVVYQLAPTDVREMYENADETWSPGPAHPVAMLGVPDARVMWLSPDARRMLFAVNAQSTETAYLAFTERASTADSFGPHTRLDLPLVFDPFILEDCSRIYFSGLRSVFYAQQL